MIGYLYFKNPAFKDTKYNARSYVYRKYINDAIYYEQLKDRLLPGTVSFGKFVETDYSINPNTDLCITAVPIPQVTLPLYSNEPYCICYKVEFEYPDNNVSLDTLTKLRQSHSVFTYKWFKIIKEISLADITLNTNSIQHMDSCSTTYQLDGYNYMVSKYVNGNIGYTIQNTGDGCIMNDNERLLCVVTNGVKYYQALYDTYDNTKLLAEVAYKYDRPCGYILRKYQYTERDLFNAGGMYTGYIEYKLKQYTDILTLDTLDNTYKQDKANVVIKDTLVSLNSPIEHKTDTVRYDIRADNDATVTLYLDDTPAITLIPPPMYRNIYKHEFGYTDNKFTYDKTIHPVLYMQGEFQCMLVDGSTLYLNEPENCVYFTSTPYPIQAYDNACMEFIIDELSEQKRIKLEKLAEDKQRVKQLDETIEALTEQLKQGE